MTGNMTRFIVIGNEPIRSSGLDKTSILISIDNKSGALSSLLQPLAKNRISMSKIESIPTKINNWEYMFLLDIDGHIDDANINSCLKIIKKVPYFKEHVIETIENIEDDDTKTEIKDVMKEYGYTLMI